MNTTNSIAGSSFKTYLVFDEKFHLHKMESLSDLNQFCSIEISMT